LNGKKAPTPRWSRSGRAEGRSLYGRISGPLAGLTPRRAFILLTMLAAAGTLLWAGTAEVDVIVRAEGQIIPPGRAQKVQHLEGGIVREILVHEGQVVTAGQPLIELSDVQVRAALEQDQARLDALRSREARLIAELDGRDRIVFPPELEGGDLARLEISAWKARKARLAEEVGALRALSRQKGNELAETRAKQESLSKELALEKKRNLVLERLHEKGAASELEVLDSRMRIQRLKTQIEEAANAIPRLKEAKTEAGLRVREAVARFRAEVSAELTRVREEIEETVHAIASDLDRLERSVVRSPVAGLINRLNVTTIGAVVRPSEVLLEITPSEERIVIQARLDPNDRAHLRPGLPARVRVGAYDYATYGTFEGRVTDVSADTLEDERGRRYYRVNIEVDVSSIAARLDREGALLPGMSASADISVGRRTVLSYLVSPLLEFRDGAFRYH